MASREARRRAVAKYQSEKVDRLVANIPKGLKEQYKLAAALQGLSLSKFIQKAVKEFVENHQINPK